MLGRAGMLSQATPLFLINSRSPSADPFDPKRSERSADVDSENAEAPDETAHAHTLQKRSVAISSPGVWSEAHAPEDAATHSLSLPWLAHMMAKKNFNPWGGKRAVSGSDLTLSKSDLGQLWVEEMGDVPQWNGVVAKRGWSAPFPREGAAAAAARGDEGDEGKELLNYWKRRSFRPWGGK